MCYTSWLRKVLVVYVPTTFFFLLIISSISCDHARRPQLIMSYKNTHFLHYYVCIFILHLLVLMFIFIFNKQINCNSHHTISVISDPTIKYTRTSYSQLQLYKTVLCLHGYLLALKIPCSTNYFLLLSCFFKTCDCNISSQYATSGSPQHIFVNREYVSYMYVDTPRHRCGYWSHFSHFRVAVS